MVKAVTKWKRQLSVSSRASIASRRITCAAFSLLASTNDKKWIRIDLFGHCECYKSQRGKQEAFAAPYNVLSSMFGQAIRTNSHISLVWTIRRDVYYVIMLRTCVNTANSQTCLSLCQTRVHFFTLLGGRGGGRGGPTGFFLRSFALHSKHGSWVASSGC